VLPKAAYFSKVGSQATCETKILSRLFDLQLDRFESDDDEILGDLFSEDDSDELIEVHVSQLDRFAGLDVCQSWFS
jgi:hypothetical protein